MSNDDVVGFFALVVVVAVLLVATARCQEPTVNAKFLALQGASFASTYLDARTTEHCLSEGYTESNPFYGSRPSAARVYGQAFGITAAEAVLSYYQKKHGSKFWWIAPTVNTGTHTFGASWNYAHCQ